MKYAVPARKPAKMTDSSPTGKGFVRWQVSPRARINEVAETGSVVEIVRNGLPYCELEALQELLQMPMDTVAAKLGLSRATLHRRKHSSKLTSEESDKIVRFARLIERARHTFGSEDEARCWLGASQFGLAGAIPLDYAQTEAGAREVEHLLGRIEYGVYS